MKVRCINTDMEKLTLKKEYEVINSDNYWYWIIDDIGGNNGYKKSLFEIVNEKKELNIIEASNMPYGTEFKVKINHYYKYDDADRIRDNTKMIAINTQSGIRFKEYEDIEKASKSLINAKFIPISKPVSTTEVFKSLDEGKIIKSYKGYKYQKEDGKIKCISGILPYKYIDFEELEGQWLVLD